MRVSIPPVITTRPAPVSAPVSAEEDHIDADHSSGALLRRFAITYLRPHPAGLAAAAAAMALVAATTGCYPLLIERAYSMFGADDPMMVALVPLAVFAVSVIKGIATYGQSVLTTALVERMIVELRRDMFARMIRADLAWLAEETSSRLTARFLEDVERVRAACFRVLNNLIRDTLTVAALAGSMIYLDWRLFLVFLGIYPLAAVPVTALGRRLRRVAKQTQAQTGGMLALLHESLSGARMIKAFGLEDYERARGRAVFEENHGLNITAIRHRAKLEPILEVLGGVVVAGVIAFAGWRVMTGDGSAGAFTGFIGALVMAAQPVRAIGTLNSVLQEGLAAAQRVFAVIDRPPAIADRAEAVELTDPKGAIRFDSVDFAYRPDLPVLRDVSFEAAPGANIAVVGPSGAGKSTLFSLIARLRETSGGSVSVDGHDVRDLTMASLRRSMAVVSQEAILFDDTVAANIAHGRPGVDPAAMMDDIRAAARAAAADDFIMALPRGYDTPVGEGGGRLSGGQRQRIALARAFLRDAPILLLDEATSALDNESERLVQQAMERLSDGRTTITIAHRLSTVRHADVIMVMDGGRIVERGEHDALVARGGLYATLCRSQLVDTD